MPEPIITDDMDEETKAIVRRRAEEDRQRAEQKAVLKRRLEDLEHEQKMELQRRETEDRKRKYMFFCGPFLNVED